jgi:hypothetical protein
MADIYNRQVSDLKGVFTSDQAVLAFSGAGDRFNTLVQQVQMSYAQTITRLYEVGGKNIYYVGGRTQGQMNVNRVIGPVGTVCAFYEKFGDVCQAVGNILTINLGGDAAAGCSSAEGAYTMKHIVITQVGIAVAAQDMIINENTTMMFSSLECSD